MAAARSAGTSAASLPINHGFRSFVGTVAAGMFSWRCRNKLRRGSEQADYPADLKKSLLPFNANPDRLVTQKTYDDAEAINGTEMINAQRNYGRIPLVVLTAADAPSPLPAAFAAPAVKSEMTDLETKTWRKAHKDLAALSTEGREELVPATTHFIQLIKPQVVVTAIDQVVAKTRIAEGQKQN